MTNLRQAIWSQTNPYSAVTQLLPEDLQGWRKSHPILMQACADAPVNALLCEVGVWKGAGVFDMALSSAWDAQILAVDTFRGSAEHWLKDKWVGYARSNQLYRQFLSNMMHMELHDTVTPLPLDSINAAHVCAAKGLIFDVTHIDGGHDYEAVMLDLRHWCGLSKVMVIDDYCDDWPDVVRAVDAFCDATPWFIADSLNGKCRLEFDGAQND